MIGNRPVGGVAERAGEIAARTSSILSGDLDFFGVRPSANTADSPSFSVPPLTAAASPAIPRRHRAAARPAVRDAPYARARSHPAWSVRCAVNNQGVDSKASTQYAFSSGKADIEI